MLRDRRRLQRQPPAGLALGRSAPAKAESRGTYSLHLPRYAAARYGPLTTGLRLPKASVSSLKSAERLLASVYGGSLSSSGI